MLLRYYGNANALWDKPERYDSDKVTHRQQTTASGTSEAFLFQSLIVQLGFSCRGGGGGKVVDYTCKPFL